MDFIPEFWGFRMQEQGQLQSARRPNPDRDPSAECEVGTAECRRRSIDLITASSRKNIMAWIAVDSRGFQNGGTWGTGSTKWDDKVLRLGE